MFTETVKWTNTLKGTIKEKTSVSIKLKVFNKLKHKRWIGWKVNTSKCPKWEENNVMAIDANYVLIIFEKAKLYLFLNS